MTLRSSARQQVSGGARPLNFNSWDLGQQPTDAIVQITLSGNAANVRLFDSANYRAFKAGRRASGYGGYARCSPVRLRVPSSGHWHVVGDFGGFPGKSGVQVLPGRLPPYGSEPRLFHQSAGS
ncbi:MAG: DUF1883 domain-containing protein [Thermocrispum sp.]